ncbi:Mitochondrial distribution and morphology protein 10 [Terramyces sp. JEL0728]|nr:Mitochondrial distribution and morphology protein 10 [Terramyces sp. JEL0728]
MEFFSQNLASFLKNTNWHDHNYYSNLDAIARDILNFETPKSLTVGIGKSISPNLKSSYNIGIQNQYSVGYMYSSFPFELEKLKIKNPTFLPKTNYLGYFEPHKLLYGRVFQDGRLEGIYCNHFRPNLMAIASATSQFHDTLEKYSNLEAKIIHNHENFSAELSYISDNQIVGINGLGQISENWAAGAEVYYTAKEKSGGLSFGLRFSSDYNDEMSSVTTFAANPIMGHFTTSYAAHLTPNVLMATQYDYNMYSYDADVLLGVQMTPPGKNQVLKAKLSLQKV